MFAAILGMAALTWYMDKIKPDDRIFQNQQGETIRVKDSFRPVELGYQEQLATKLPWGAERTTHIGNMDCKNPLPYINIMPGGENTAVSDMRQTVLPRQKEKFKELVHVRENLEEYWRFDNYLGGKYPMANTTLHRDSSIAYQYQ